MPYQRRPRKYVRRQPVRKNDKHIRQVVKKELKKEIESKYFDYNANTTVSSTAVINYQPLTGITRGTGVSSFIGSKIRPTYLMIRGVAAAGDGTNILRMLVIQDKAVSGTPALGTIFQNTTYPWLSPLNADFIDSYTVLADKTMVLNVHETAAGTFSSEPRLFKFKIPGKKLRQIAYTASGVVDVGTIWVVTISDSSAPLHPGWTMASRLTFTDA